MLSDLESRRGRKCHWHIEVLAPVAEQPATQSGCRHAAGCRCDRRGLWESGSIDGAVGSERRYIIAKDFQPDMMNSYLVTHTCAGPHTRRTVAPMNRLAITVTIIVVGLIASCFACREFVARRPVASNRPWDLWIAALNGFKGPVYYAGDRDGYSDFRGF